MENYEKLLKDISSTTKGAEKINLLKHNNLNAGELEILKFIFKKTYDPFNTYGIKNYTKAGVGEKTFTELKPEIEGLLDKLIIRELSGNKAKAEVSRIYSELDEPGQLIWESILRRDLLVGMSPKTFNSVFPDTIPIYECALAEKIGSRMEKISKEFDGHTWFMSRKLDGLRCQVFFGKSYETPVFHTREGLTFKTLSNLIPSVEALKNLPELADGDYVLDGECCVIDEYGHEDFQSVLSQYNKKDYTIPNPTLKAFDLLTEEQFFMKKASDIFEKRQEKLHAVIVASHVDNIQWVEQIGVTSVKQVMDFKDFAASQGWEGLMLRKNLPYSSGRSLNMLKVKEFQDDEFTVLGVNVGDKSYAIKGKGQVMINGVTDITFKYKDSIVHCGAGITRDQSIDWKAHPEHIVGKTITVQYFGEMINQDGGHNLRFPTLKAVYTEGRHT